MSGSHGSSKSKPQATPQQILDLYTQYLPQTAGVTFGQAPNIANTLAGAAAQSNPIYTASGLQQLQQFAPGYAQAGNDIAQINASGQADLLAGQGSRAAINADLLSRAINPEFYNTRAQLAGDASQLLSSFNGGRMSGGELAAAERAINQGNSATGNLGNVSPYSTVANALNFGDYARQKQQMYGNAINTVTGTLGSLQNTDFNPVSTALGAGNAGNNFALGQFNASQGNPLLGEASNFGSNIFGGLTGIGGAGTSKSSNTSAGICYITTAACEYFGKPDNCDELQTLRKFRDEWLALQEGGKKLIAEYYQSAPKIMNLLKNNADKDRLFVLIWENYILPCVYFIKEGKFEEAKNRYIKLVNNLNQLT